MVPDKMEGVLCLAAAAWRVRAQGSKKAPENKTISRESDPGTPLQETGTSLKESGEANGACYASHNTDHYHNSRHCKAHLYRTASQELAHVKPTTRVCTLADAHGKVEAKSRNEGDTKGYQPNKTQSSDCAP